MEISAEVKRIGVTAAVVVVVAVGMFSAGRFSAPRSVATSDVQQIDFKALTTEDITKGFTTQKVMWRTVFRDVTTTATDAGVVTVDKTIEREGTDEHAASTTTDAKAATSSGTTVTEHKSVTTLQPDWRIGLLVGASLKPPALPITGPLVLGAQVERRIVGGVSLGVWVNTVGAAGGVVSVEF